MTESAATPTLDESLGYRDCVPLVWEPLAAMPDAAQRGHWQDQNLRLLTAAALLEERPRRTDADEPLAAEVERLHHKFDLALELLAALLRKQSPLPPPVVARISTAGVSWRSEAPPSAGSLILLQIHLHPGLPSPLVWPADVLPGATQEAHARFRALGDSCALAMERHVFIRHRRSVADARSPGARGETPSAH